MQIEKSSPIRAVDNAFLQETIGETAFEQFRSRLLRLLNQADDAIQNGESEEHLKNLIKPFLSATNFGEDYFINTKDRQDLAIHNGKTGRSTVGVILEAKRPSNKEMITTGDINRKAFHEAILYYLRERIENGNEDIKHIIITDVYRWFVFDAQDFERYFYDSKKLRGWFDEWNRGRKVSSKTKFVYNHLSEFIDAIGADIKAIRFDIRGFRPLLEKDKLSRDEQKKLVPLFKFFTPTHLLKLPFASDSNNLNKGFYRELLYIMGLQEYKEKGTHYITRMDEGNRHPASLIENTITQLKSLSVLSQISGRMEYGETEDEQLFNVAIQLLITWINRILFLKLLEAQLYKYHREDERFRFLSHRQIEEYDDLNKLFFQVLAVPEQDRSERIRENYGHIPYLNSSLFDVAGIEREAVRISELEDGLQMPVYSHSKIHNKNGKRLKGESVSGLEYLLRFLDAYSFNTEGTAEVQEEAKTLINASVLGRIFEKINGYKDGSFFTPGYITEYMCRETIRRAVLQKFGEVLAPSSPTTLNPGPSPSRRSGEQKQPDSHPSTTGGGRTEDGGGWKLPESLIKNARYLRKNATDAEQLLWQLLRNRQLQNAKFRRQHPIKEGIILDFYCHQAKLAVEIDGGYHNTKEQQAADAERTERLNGRGIHVIRFTNEQVLEDAESVLAEIAEALSLGPDTLSPSFPLPRGRGTSQGQEEEKNEGEGSRAPATENEGELTFANIHNAIGRDISIREANEIINSVTICDPAVGSGHFLVSALNELLAIKSDLGIFCYLDEERNYRRFRDVDISVDNDELRISVGSDPFFEYRVQHQWKETGDIKRTVGSDTQRLQKALFREKNILIENCLFGVDINPNSVNICRLRLWVELLKHAYYKESAEDAHSLNLGSSSGETHPQPQSFSLEGEGSGAAAKQDEGASYQELEVLPNIDINIKQGNSLVSRFGLDADLSSVFSGSDHSVDDYKKAVRNYKHTRDKTEKRRLQTYIDDVKEEFSTTLINNRPINKKLSKARGTLEVMQNADLFGDTKFTKKQIKEQQKEVKQLEETKAAEESGVFYNQAFEWRFEFPEVLDEEGTYTGFDAVIGNPPYIRQELLKDIKPYLKDNYSVYHGTADLYQYFVEQGMDLLKEKGYFHYIVSNKWMRTNYGKPLREWMKEYQIKSIVDFGDLPVFEEATTYPCLLQLSKEDSEKPFRAAEINDLEFENLYHRLGQINFYVDQTKLLNKGWSLISTEAQRLLHKIKEKGMPLGEYVNGEIYRGILTGLNEAFIIDENTKDELIEKDSSSAKLIKPFLKGRDINRYEPPKSNKYLILLPNGWTNKKTDNDDKLDWLKNEYPAIAGHLNQFSEKAKKRYDQGDYWWELRACSYYEEFEQPKIILPDISKRGQFTFDSKGEYYMVNTAYMICSKKKYLLGILCSDLVDFFYRNISSKYRGDYLRFIFQYLEQIPIARTDKKEKEKIGYIVDQILSKKKDNPEAGTSELEAKIDQLVYKLYGLSEEEIAIVEGI